MERPRSVVVEAPKGLVSLNLRDLWAYRELLYTFVWRDLKVRYKQTILGVSWALLQPLLTMAIFTVIFGRIARISSDGLPYPIFAYCALVPWYYFANALSQSSLVLVSHQHMITKVYFPRLVLPLSAVFSGLVDFAINFLFLLLMMLYFGFPLTARIAWMPLFLLLAIATAAGTGFWLSALHVLYRDVRFLVPFFTQIWMFVSPIVYPTSLVPSEWRPFYGINPMAGVVEGFRWILLGTAPPDRGMLLISSGMVVLLCLSGLYFFRHVERTMADRI